jgi:hypothetical protein
VKTEDPRHRRQFRAPSRIGPPAVIARRAHGSSAKAPTPEETKGLGPAQGQSEEESQRLARHATKHDPYQERVGGARIVSFGGKRMASTEGA